MELMRNKKIVTFIFLIMSFVVPAKVADDEMVLIPAGTFQMGNPDGESGDDNYPVRSVTIDSFYMGKFEVTVGQFKAFVKDTGYESSMSFWEGYFVSPEDSHPVVGVDWFAANAYAQWAGVRLPTEAEWEYAARGGLADMSYPWGNELDHDKANYHRAWKSNITYDYPNYITTGRTDEWRYSSAPVGSFEPNGFGLYDMAGNVTEWCQDWYQRGYYLSSPTDNPQGPQIGDEKVTRGGHWFSWNLGLRVHNRGSNPPDVKGWQDVQGFRLAVDLK
ncbi:MAG TPA: formylglycine-generating enzyme family protein [Candidatus Thioglobus sp.]|nr:formylglycine-generating enzyme family protein [Candidatus Thioglobus sp.]HIL21502.1 formylglycine-generating enzyme family protein [Candidatus Thioglobus sp.]